MTVEAFFDQATNTISYILYDQKHGHAALIDPVLDFDLKSGTTSTGSADLLIDFIHTHDLTLDWILETHIHADHLTAAHYLKEKLGAKIAVSEHIKIVQENFKNLFNLPQDFEANGADFDLLLKDGQEFNVGSMTIKAIHTPGHTPACVSYIVDNTAFIGDTIFMPDSGSARCDFPGGSATQLYNSIQKILSLPDDTLLYLCHDYGCGSKRDIKWQTTVAEEKKNNIHFKNNTSAEHYIKMRETRDAELSVPDLLLPAIQVNIHAGKLPKPEDNGLAYLKIPLNGL